MSSIKETMEQFAAFYQEIENRRTQQMIVSEIARFNEIVSKEISDALVDLLEKDNLDENFVVELFTTPSGLYLICLKTPLAPNGEKIVEFESLLGLEFLREELKKAHGKEEKYHNDKCGVDAYRYTFNFPKIAK